jgi:hypothetical protein
LKEPLSICSIAANKGLLNSTSRASDFAIALSEPEWRERHSRLTCKTISNGPPDGATRKNRCALRGLRCLADPADFGSVEHLAQCLSSLVVRIDRGENFDHTFRNLGADFGGTVLENGLHEIFDLQLMVMRHHVALSGEFTVLGLPCLEHL